LNECRAAANVWIAQHKPTPRSITAAVVILLLWMAFFWALWKYWGDNVLKWFSAAWARSASCILPPPPLQG